ncbi:hypothetical protein B0H11DRAFT_1727332 [Mycena galericulata]|nr:hypothetical protein B0H11DRAFT_1727332 [Mycena galericulata]
MKPLSATNLATHFHLDCDLYLHNIYRPRGTEAKEPSELTKANFKRGLDWEQSCLLPFLDRVNLLLTVPSVPLDGNVLRANIEADDREHFFVAGIEFWPPQEFIQRFLDRGVEPVHFGVAKPDLLEITRTPLGVTWTVIDVKASKTVKAPHHVQIYFYSLCLSYILRNPYFRPTGYAAIWLPPAHGFDTNTIPSLQDLRSIRTDLLAPSLDEFLFHRLPEILSLPYGTVNWHLNHLCRACPFKPNCKQRAVEHGELGAMPNISLAQARTIRFLMAVPRKDSAATTDIEDLHLLLSDTAAIAASFPATLKRVKRMLAVQPISHSSPILEAARTKTIQVIPRCSFTCPRREDIAIVISLILDPSLSQEDIAYFCITVFSSISSLESKSVYGCGSLFITALSAILRDILSLNAIVQPLPLTQFYVFSAAEQDRLHAHLVHKALTSTSGSNEDLRLCIGALAQGASLLQTTFQPPLLSGALLAFMAKSHRSKSELQTCLERMDLPTSGTLPELRQRISDEIRRLQAEGVQTNGTNDQRAELGQLPRIVILKKQIEHLLALPIPGWWDLVDCAYTLLSPTSPYRDCPTDEDLFAMYNGSQCPEALHGRLDRRNKSIYAVLCDMQARVAESGTSLLVNDAKVLTAKFMDVCKNTVLRKLFFMQQLEVLAKLSDLWKARIEGCPDAPVLEYRETLRDVNGPKHVCYLVSGDVEMSAGQKEGNFYDYIITEDENIPGNIPIEALYNDLGFSGIRFPLSHYHRSKWTEQNPIVQQRLLVADLLDIRVDGNRTRVTLKTWGKSDAALVVGRHYRLSPRLVDFNTTKVLSTLLELDMQVTASRGDHGNIPFLRLVLEPGSFSNDPGFDQHGKELVVTETAAQDLMKNLANSHSIAGALVLKPSQQRAVHHILSNRLSILWGPPVI